MLIEGIKELELQVTKLQEQIQSSSSSGGKLKSGSIQQNTSSNATEVTSALNQNYPNPWTSSTTIKMSIDHSATSAMVCIYDMTGKQLKCEMVTDRGETQVTIHEEELQAGMYMYSLIVDGQLVDTKTMVLTEQ